MTKKYHFIGIGGIGMGAIASILIDKGFSVSGSDLKNNNIIEGLKAKGAEIFIGHSAKNISGSDCVVYSSAVKEDNKELIEAKKRGKIIMKRAEALAELMKGQESITIAGAHGKTTVTSMISNMLDVAGMSPSLALGGVANATSTNANLGEGNYFVAEADESDGSFLFFTPKYSVITNIDFEHLDHYKDFNGIIDCYSKFIERTEKDGELIICGDCEKLYELTKDTDKNITRYGTAEHNDMIAKDIVFNGLMSWFECIYSNESLGRFEVKMPGIHNVLNCMACICVGIKLGIDNDVIKDSLKYYKGVQRRFQVRYDNGETMIIDDYAHHPSEVRATLDAANCVMQKRRPGLKNKQGRIITVFQPHRFSRIKYLLNEFAKSFVKCDKLIITDIYAASEEPIAGITPQLLVEEIRKKTGQNVDYFKKENIIETLSDVIDSGDMVLMLGAGDITKICSGLVEEINRNKDNDE